MRRVFVWLHPASPCCWLLLPPPHSEQCITSHKSASSGELQYSTVQHSTVQCITSHKSASQRRAAELQSFRAEHNGRSSCERSQVPDTKWTGILGWRVREGMGVTGVSVFLLIACGDNLTATGSGHPFLPYSFSFAWIYIAE